VKDIRRKTRKRYSSEDKIRIVLAGLRGDDSIAELCRQEGIAQSQYYSWSKEFMEAGRVIIPENHWVENWTSPAFDALGERHEEIEIYGKPDPDDFEAG
jgi:transposase-like protein